MTAAPADQRHEMKPWRKALASGVILFIVAGYMYDSIRRHNNWPFHPFTMFSVLPRTRNHSLLRLVAVDKGGHEILLSDPAYSVPITIFHVRLAFARAIDAGDCAKLQRLSRDYLERYERHRQAGLHAGPMLSGLRVYELRWNRIDPWAANVTMPDQKILTYDSQLSCPDALITDRGQSQKTLTTEAQR